MKGIFKAYKKGLKLVLQILLVTIVLSAFSFLIVFPIWLFAEKFPSQYTFFCSTILCLGLVFLILKNCIKRYKHDKVKFLNSLIKFGIFSLSFIFSIYALLNINRILALITFIAPFILIFLLENVDKEKKSET